MLRVLNIDSSSFQLPLITECLHMILPVTVDQDDMGEGDFPAEGEVSDPLSNQSEVLMDDDNPLIDPETGGFLIVIPDAESKSTDSSVEDQPPAQQSSAVDAIHLGTYFFHYHKFKLK